ncbi:hypothetical protein AU210_015816 [Fusarium oxysporum f. sp. radicis-cucumerinum]|uniref:BZIP domain-containing protein n=1 Tax=Fusarium oxysporum f. sp. radicis-cucumerinum TaxID=327505 RepID=A0A2H3G4S4_FUSOX|nr:hypothetical protein AU210_015816 [Fusarium oxysporum f. sp. radicis-cucumerinum]
MSPYSPAGPHQASHDTEKACVSGINNSRLAQRGAKDREAQRVFRTGLGRRMEQLERDVEQLKNRQNTAPPVNELYLRIRLLEEDLVSLLGDMKSLIASLLCSPEENEDIYGEYGSIANYGLLFYDSPGTAISGASISRKSRTTTSSPSLSKEREECKESTPTGISFRQELIV